MRDRDAICAFRDLRYGYVEAGRRREVLHGVAGDIGRGKAVALLGRSGAG